MQTIGDKIKSLRLAAGLNQIQLADKLGISNQAVSKWETNFAQPDTTLLPDLATTLGVSIDDLFGYTRDKMYEKIGSRIENGSLLSHQEFQDYGDFLLKEVNHDPSNYDANSLLGWLYYSQARNLNERAVVYAKKALELQPNSKGDMTVINNASGGTLYDWNVKNHADLIDYYQKILKIAPENKRLYWFLLDNLIDDWRLDEAKQVLKQSRHYNPDALNDYYELFIEEQEYGFAAVKGKYADLAKRYADDWRILFAIANSCSYKGAYAEAIPIWQAAFDAQEKPRYSDYHEAIAQCYLLMGERDNAIKAYQDILVLLKDEWQLHFSTTNA